MNRAFLATFLGGLLLFTDACKGKTDSKDAIRAGIVKHIASMNGLNLANMEITVTQATVNGDKAQASVDIRAKNSDPSAPAMQVSYQLEKQGPDWVVVKGAPTGGMQHPAPGEKPPSVALPPGHAIPGGAGGQTPTSHPDFNSIMKTAQPPAQQPSTQQAPANQPPTQQPYPSSGKP